jgi:hypothetical protein
MEKKGDIFNQLAIISELLEQCNIVSNNQAIIIELDRDEFVRVYKLTQLKAKRSLEIPKTTFNIKIGSVDIIFNMNSV